MTNETLRQATADEIADNLAFGLRYEGRKRVHHADEMMARVTADRLVRHLELAGFVIMRRPAGVGAAARLGEASRGEASREASKE